MSFSVSHPAPSYEPVAVAQAVRRERGAKVRVTLPIMGLMENFRFQAEACAQLGSPMYAELIRSLVDDLQARGRTADLLHGYEDAPGPSATCLRLLGGLHYLVLGGEAPELAAYYPSVGGRWDATDGPEAALQTLEQHRDSLREFLTIAPQTNEVGRSAGLMAALLSMGEPADLPIRLYEIGSSAGLNLNPGHYTYVDSNSVEYGAPDSPVRIENAWPSRELARKQVDIVSADGGDISPVRLNTETERTRLLAYVWPDNKVRVDRLRAALQVAAIHPPNVLDQGAVDFAASMSLEPKTLTVLWHSIMWQYLPAEDQHQIQASIDALAQSATADQPLTHIRLEPVPPDPAEHPRILAVAVELAGQR